MKMTKKLVLLIAFLIALVLTVSSALALEVTSEPGVATEGKLYTYDIDVDIDNPDFLKVVPSGWTAKESPKIEADTGVMTWLPHAGEYGDFKFSVLILNKDDNTKTWKTFIVLTEPVLDIVKMEVGKKGETLSSYSEGDETAAFKPGEELTFKLTVKNKYTADSHELTGNSEPTIKDISFSSASIGLNNFPSGNDVEKFLLTKNEEKEIELTYKLPYTTTTGSYPVQFGVDGKDYFVFPANQYSSLRTISLKVEQKNPDVQISETSMVGDNNNDGKLSCTEKTGAIKLNVKLWNTGLDNEDVKVTILNAEIGLDSATITTVNKGASKWVTFSLAEEEADKIVNTKPITIKVEDLYGYQVFDTETHSVDGEDCTLGIDSTTPGSPLVLLQSNDKTTFSAEVNNPGNVQGVTYEWTLDGSPVPGYDDNGVQKYEFTPSQLGQHTVKFAVKENNQVVDDYSWEVTVADRPVDIDQFPGDGTTDLVNEQDPTQVANFTLENSFGKIEFTGDANGNVDLSEILKLTDYISIESNKVSVDSGNLPADTHLENGGTITLKKTFNKPVIQKSENGVNFEECTVGCQLVSNSNGKFIFTVDSFSMYQVVEEESFLTIKKIDFDDIKLDEDFEVTVKVKNDYTEDMDDVEVTVRIMEGSKEIAEESEELDLKDGDEKDFEFTFDLSKEDLDEDEYTIEVKVKGKADDNTHHEIVETKTVKVDREKHQVIIKDAKVSPNLLQCSANRQFTIDVEIENVGESDEDDVEIRVKNSDLKLDLKRSNLDLDDFSGSDNDYSTTFNFLLTEAVKAGKYPLTIQVYSDGDLQDEEEVEIEILDCLTAGSDSDSVNEFGKLNTDLQNKLAEYVKTREQAKVTGSFRESDTYTLLLGVLVVLAFIAALLTVAVLIVKKK